MNPLRLVSKNIGLAYLQKFDSFLRFFLPHRGTMPADRLEGVVERLLAHNPDVVLLQEVKEPHLPVIEGLMPGYKGFLGGETGGEYRYTFVRREWAKGVEYRKVSVNHGTDVPVGVSTFLPERDVLVMNVHLAFGDRDLRIAQLEAALEAANGHKRVVIAGDYNMRDRLYWGQKSRETTRRMRGLLESHGFRDVSENIGPTFSVAGWSQVQLDYVFSNLPKHEDEWCRVVPGRVALFEDHDACSAQVIVPYMTTNLNE